MRKWILVGLVVSFVAGAVVLLMLLPTRTPPTASQTPGAPPMPPETDKPAPDAEMDEADEEVEALSKSIHSILDDEDELKPTPFAPTDDIETAPGKIRRGAAPKKYHE